MSGRVQGVGYRFFTRSVAVRLGLRGFVRNLPDGSVEVQAEGDEAALDALRSELDQGPFGAEVRGIIEESLDSSSSYSTFSIRG